jgi:TatD DNase family protein
MKKVVETVPLERIVLETDSPYLTPIPHRGKRNEPSFVKFVAEKVAEIKGISLEEVEKTTTQNAKLLFKI